jgi:membrane protease YdiL (CAAX protease family)
MSSITLSDISGKQAHGKETLAPTSLAYRLGLSVLLLICALAVFLLGANYYKMFPTNGSSLYTGLVSAVFLIAAMLFKRSVKFGQYWPIAYAFFVASMVNFVSSLFAGYNTEFIQLFGARAGTNPGQGLGKLYETLLAVIPILVLIRLSGADLGTLLLKKGNLHYKWGVGIGALILVNYLTSVLIFFGAGYNLSQLGPAIVWGAVFSFSNSLLEELWVRGLFLKKLVPLIGPVGTVVVSSIWFGALHFLNVAFLPAYVVPIMVVNTITLGLACSILMLKTDSLWGAFLIHAAADLFLFIAMLAVH